MTAAGFHCIHQQHTRPGRQQAIIRMGGCCQQLCPDTQQGVGGNLQQLPAAVWPDLCRCSSCCLLELDALDTADSCCSRSCSSCSVDCLALMATYRSCFTLLASKHNSQTQQHPSQAGEICPLTPQAACAGRDHCLLLGDQAPHLASCSCRVRRCCSVSCCAARSVAASARSFSSSSPSSLCCCTCCSARSARLVAVSSWSLSCCTRARCTSSWWVA